jgi:fluoride ion exporter CrcB/FEX
MPTHLKDILWISLGAIAGANLRYAVNRMAAQYISASLPYGTLLVNVTGSFLIGLFLVWTTERVLADRTGVFWWRSVFAARTRPFQVTRSKPCRWSNRDITQWRA